MRRNLYILAQCTFLLFITLLVNGLNMFRLKQASNVARETVKIK